MWDIDTIIRENNRVAAQLMAEGQKIGEIYRPQSNRALASLARKFTTGPPRLDVLAIQMKNSQEEDDFLQLVRKFLPGREKEIMREPLDSRVYQFCHFFARRYYPLPPKTTNAYYFASILPVELMGMSYDAYHELDMRRGLVLLLSLVVYPYQNSERSLCSEEFYGEKDAGRIPLLAVIARDLGKEVARRIPRDGWDPAFLHKVTDGTQYDGLGDFADWAVSNTGCAVLDFSYSNCSYEEGSSEPDFEWSTNNVERLTKEWPVMNTIRAKIDRLVEQVEYSTAYFTGILDFLLSKTPGGYKPKYAGYSEELHWCDLDIGELYDEEEDYDDKEEE